MTKTNETKNELVVVGFQADAKLIDSLMDLSDKFAGASRSQLVRMAVKEFIERHGCN